MNQQVILDEVLHDGGVVVFRACVPWGTVVRMVARREVLGRVPIPGESWEIGGTWETHPRYGRQVVVSSATPVRPSGRLLIDAIAHSPDFPGIGFARAQRLWDTYGERLSGLLDAGAPGPFINLLGEERARIVVDGWRIVDNVVRAHLWLCAHGLPAEFARKIVDIYGATTIPTGAPPNAEAKGSLIWRLEDDPYRMLAFVGWRTVDAAARRLGVQVNDDRRLVGAVEAALADLHKENDTWINEDRLGSIAAHILNAPRSMGKVAIQKALRVHAVVAHAGGYQAIGPHVMEQFIADRCAEMTTGRFAPRQSSLVDTPTRVALDAVLDQLEAWETYTLNAEQREGVWMALSQPLSLLLGGPGVGKTTVLQAVHVGAESVGRAVHQAALSGRAARRMAEITGRPAATIASLMTRIKTGEVRLDAEPLIIIDEASMVDLPTLYQLLRLFESGTRLLLVGDTGQLPPVTFGLTLHALTDDIRIPRTMLTRVMRQTEESSIPLVCAAIREGRIPTLTTLIQGRRNGVSFVEAEREEIVDVVVDLLTRLGGVGAAQIIGPVKRGVGGVRAINERLQAISSGGRRLCYQRFFVGEPVIATKNDYDLDVMNGDLGTVLREGDGGLLCRFDTGEKVVPIWKLGDYELAYAITCHKSQGSRFPRVIVPITQNYLLDRALLLTAVSRAETQAIIVGNGAGFDEAVVAPPTSSVRQIGLGRR